MGDSVYSVGVRLGRGAVGTIALHAARGLAHAGLLQRLIAGASTEPLDFQADLRQMGILHRAAKRIAFSASSGQMADWTDALFDVWAQRAVPGCSVYHGWGNMCLRQLRRARLLGAKCIVERASTHPLAQARILAEEAERWHIGERLTIASAIQRALAEYESTDFILVPSLFAYESHLAEGVPARKLLLVPFGVDATRFAPIDERPRKKLTLLFVGQVSARKGVPNLLAAWRLARLSDAELLLVGHVAPEMRAILAEYADMANLRVLGHQDPTSLYAIADAFVFPSIEEGSALVTYEAMASGLPVVVTPNSGSVAVDGAHGRIIPAGDPTKLAAALVEIATKPELRQMWGTAARQRALEYTWHRYGERIAEAHHRIASGETPSGPGWLLS